MSILTLSQYEANVVKLPLNFRNSLDISIIKKWFLIAFLVLFVLMCIRGYSNYDLILACIMAGVIIFNNAQYVYPPSSPCPSPGGAHIIAARGSGVQVIQGYGAIGQNVAAIGAALGMRVLVAERKGAGSVREGRVGFEECLRSGTVFIVVVPSSSDGSTRDLFGRREFEVMNESAVIVNAGRGGTYRYRP